LQEILGSKLVTLRPQHAGRTHAFQGYVLRVGDAFALKGVVQWEEWADKVNVKIEMTRDEAWRVSPSHHLDSTNTSSFVGKLHEFLPDTSMERINITEGIALEILDRWVRDRMAETKDFMRVRRLEIWTAEEAKFVEMYDRLPSSVSHLVFDASF